MIFIHRTIKNNKNTLLSLTITFIKHIIFYMDSCCSYICIYKHKHDLSLEVYLIWCNKS